MKGGGGRQLSSDIPVAVIKLPDGKRLGGERACFSSQCRSVRHRGEVKMAAGHIPATVKIRKRMNVHIPPFHAVQDPNPGKDASQC